MASVKKYETAKGYAWRVQYRSPDGKSRTKQGFRTKNEAQAWADKNAVSIHEQDWINPNAGKVTIGDLYQVWEPTLSRLKPKTRHDMLTVYRNHVKPRWGTTPIQSITRSQVQAWITGINRSASLVRQAHAVLAQLLQVAVDDKRIRENPARGVKLPRKASGVKVYLTARQLSDLAGECSKHSELVWLLGTTGLRWGEAVALRPIDLDPLRGRIRVERNAVSVGNEIIFGTPKTHERRTVAVPKFVMDMLLGVSRGREDLLWVNRDGNPLKTLSHGSWFHRAVDRLQLRQPDFPTITPHGLRHVAAGLMVSAGANVKVVQRQLGHASAAMTLDTYADLFDGDLDEVASAMDESFSDVVELSWNG